MVPANADTFPVLHAFFNREQQLRALRHLPALLAWNKLLLGLFNKKLDREQARNTCFTQLLNEISDAVGVFPCAFQPHNQALCDCCVQEKPRWHEAFDGFCGAWNESWKNVQRFGCLVIPVEFRSIVMGPEVPISFCLVSEQDEGICSLALIRFLAERHNEFVQLVDVCALASPSMTVH